MFEKDQDCWAACLVLRALYFLAWTYGNAINLLYIVFFSKKRSYYYFPSTGECLFVWPITCCSLFSCRWLKKQVSRCALWIRKKIQEGFYILGHLLKEAKALLIMGRQMKTSHKEQTCLHFRAAVNYLFSPAVAWRTFLSSQETKLSWLSLLNKIF